MSKQKIILFLYILLVCLLFIPRNVYIKETINENKTSNEVKFIFESPKYIPFLQTNKENNIKFTFNKQSYFSLDALHLRLRLVL